MYRDWFNGETNGARVLGGGGMVILDMTSLMASLEGMYCLRGTMCLLRGTVSQVGGGRGGCGGFSGCRCGWCGRCD